jgi:hypothetical protein
VHIAAEVLRLPVSAALQASVHAGPHAGDLSGYEHFVASPRVLLEQAIHEVTRLSRQGRITFLIDGLEKVPQGVDSALLFAELAALPDSVDVVLVVPWYATFGARPDAIVRAGERFLPLRAVDVNDPAAHGREFLYELFVRRVGNDGVEEHAAIIDEAAQLSGGMPRTFLQLLADAASYARLSRSTDWPTHEHLASAVLDQQDSFLRLLLPGDTDAIRAAIGTDGREMEIARKVRLMAHGMLLERSRGRTIVLELHPLADVLREATK